MQEVNKTKDVFLTKAQFEARKTAGTLEEGVIYHTTDETVLTPDSLKTIFGNQSLIKDPSKPNENNVDLYNHFITLTTSSDEYFIKIQSSSNVDCTGVGTKLKDLLKCVNGTAKFIDICFDLEDGTAGCLYFDGTSLILFSSIVFSSFISSL